MINMDEEETKGSGQCCRKKGLKMMFASSIASTLLLFVFSGVLVQMGKKTHRMQDFVEHDEPYGQFLPPAITICQVRPFMVASNFQGQATVPLILYSSRIWLNSTQVFGPSVEYRWKIANNVTFEGRVRYEGGLAGFPATETSRSLLALPDPGDLFDFEQCYTAKFNDSVPIQMTYWTTTPTPRTVRTTSKSSSTTTTATTAKPRANSIRLENRMPDLVRNFSVVLSALPRPMVATPVKPRTMIFVHDPEEKPSILFHSRLGREIPNAALFDRNAHSVEIEVVGGRRVEMSVGTCKDGGSQFEEQRKLFENQVANEIGCSPKWTPLGKNERNSSKSYCDNFLDGLKSVYKTPEDNGKNLKTFTQEPYLKVLNKMSNDREQSFRTAAYTTLPKQSEGVMEVLEEPNCASNWFGHETCHPELEVLPRCKFWAYNVIFSFDGGVVGSYQQG